MAYRSQAKLHAGQAIGIGVSSDLKEGLDKFAKKVGNKATRAATFAMADTLYKEMKVNARKGDDATGNLANAMYTHYDDARAHLNIHTYAVGVNKQKAGNWHWIEYGRWRHYQTIKIGDEWITLKDRPLENPVWVPPTPYLRPAYDAKIGAAFGVFKQRFAEALRES